MKQTRHKRVYRQRIALLGILAAAVIAIIFFIMMSGLLSYAYGVNIITVGPTGSGATYTSLRTAIEDAHDGDTIEIMGDTDGVFTEIFSAANSPIDIDKSIRITSSTGERVLLKFQCPTGKFGALPLIRIVSPDVTIDNFAGIIVQGNAEDLPVFVQVNDDNFVCSNIDALEAIGATNKNAAKTFFESVNASGVVFDNVHVKYAEASTLSSISGSIAIKADGGDLKIVNSTFELGKVMTQTALSVSNLDKLAIKGSTFYNTNTPIAMSASSIHNYVIGVNVKETTIDSSDFIYLDSATGISNAISIDNSQIDIEGDSFNFTDSTFEASCTSKVSNGITLSGIDSVSVVNSKLKTPPRAVGISTLTTINHLLKTTDCEQVTLIDNEVLFSSSGKNAERRAAVEINGSESINLEGNSFSNNVSYSQSLLVNRDISDPVATTVTSKNDSFTVIASNANGAYFGSAGSVLFEGVDAKVLNGSVEYKSTSAIYLATGVDTTKFVNGKFYLEGAKNSGNECVVIIGLNEAEFNDCEINLGPGGGKGICVRDDPSGSLIHDYTNAVTFKDFTVNISDRSQYTAGISIHSAKKVVLSNIDGDTNVESGTIPPGDKKINYCNYIIQISDAGKTGSTNSVAVSKILIEDCDVKVTAERSIGIAISGTAYQDPSVAGNYIYTIQDVVVKNCTFDVKGELNNATRPWEESDRVFGLNITRAINVEVFGNTASVDGYYSKGISIGMGQNNVVHSNTIYGLNYAYFGLLSDGIGTTGAGVSRISQYMDDHTVIRNNTFSGKFLRGLYLCSNFNEIYDNDFSDAAFTQEQIHVHACQGGNIHDNHFAPQEQIETPVIFLKDAELNYINANTFHFVNEAADYVLAASGSISKITETEAGPISKTTEPEESFVEDNNTIDGAIPVETEIEQDKSDLYDQKPYRYELRLPREVSLFITKQDDGGVPLQNVVFGLFEAPYTAPGNEIAPAQSTDENGEIAFQISELSGSEETISDIQENTKTTYTPFFSDDATTKTLVLVELTPPSEYPHEEGKQYELQISRNNHAADLVVATQTGTSTDLEVSAASMPSAGAGNITVINTFGQMGSGDGSTDGSDDGSGDGSGDGAGDGSGQGSSASASIYAKKEVVNATLSANQFMFGIYEGDTLVSTGTNDANGVISFQHINYTSGGTYHYRMVELSSGGSGWTKDLSEYPVTVAVSDNGGILTADVQYPSGEPVFRNVYNADEAQTGSADSNANSDPNNDHSSDPDLDPNASPTPTPLVETVWMPSSVMPPSVIIPVYLQDGTVAETIAEGEISEEMPEIPDTGERILIPGITLAVAVFAVIGLFAHRRKAARKKQDNN